MWQLYHASIFCEAGPHDNIVYRLWHISNPVKASSFEYIRAVKRVREVAACLDYIIEAQKQNQQPVSPVTSMNPYEELKRLKELLDMGVINHDDFDAKKKQLLGL